MIEFFLPKEYSYFDPGGAPKGTRLYDNSGNIILFIYRTLMLHILKTDREYRALHALLYSKMTSASKLNILCHYFEAKLQQFCKTSWFCSIVREHCRNFGNWLGFAASFGYYCGKIVKQHCCSIETKMTLPHHWGLLWQHCKAFRIIVN